VVFGREEEMLAPVRCWLEAQGMSVQCEVKTPWGYCDVVGCCLDETRVQKRLELRQLRQVRNHRLIEILWRLPDAESGCSMSLLDLINSMAHNVKKEKLATDLGFLVAGNFVQETRPNSFQKLNGWFPLQKHLVAVELKLARVSDVIAQANSNTHFAETSYAAMPKEVALRAASSRYEEFLEAGIGLLAVEPDSCTVLIEAGNRVAGDELLQAACVERFWAPQCRT